MWARRVRCSNPDSSRAVTSSGRTSRNICATTVASGFNGPQGIAVDRSNVFWSTKGTEANKFHDGTVATVPKP